MFLLEAIDIEKQFAERTILKFEELRVYEGDKIGIVGANGAGKTTLLRILSNELEADKGRVVTSARIKVLHQFSKPSSSLSGGERRKKEITEIVGKDNTLVFADEPTANLDHKGKIWLENTLKALDTLVIISHDRDLLDTLCNRIIEVSEGKLKFYSGNYSDYAKEKQLSEEQLKEAHKKYNAKKTQLEKVVQQKEQKVHSMRQRAKRGQLNNNSQARLGKYKLELSYKKIQREATVTAAKIDRLERPERLSKAPTVKLDFELTDPPKNKRLISSASFSFAYTDSVIFDKAKFEILLGEKLAICGENGSGKTTLLKEIVAQNPAISIAPKLKIGYLTQDFSQLKMKKTVLENALETNIQTMPTVYSVLAGLLFVKSDLNKLAQSLSGGERLRLCLAMMILSDNNALFLDEPTNYLDIATLEVLEQTLIDYPGLVVLVSHDGHFVDKVATRKLYIQDKKITENQEKKPVKTNQLLLELERSRLVGEISQASLQEREKLESRYSQVIAELKTYSKTT